jgi:hypothetical protein
MAFQISPGVNVSEIDLTTVVPSVQTTTGAFAGTFQWGPANKIKLIGDEITLASTFGKPDSTTSTSFFTCSNFLAYGNSLNVVRAVGDASYNASSASAILIKNEDIYEITYLLSGNSNTYGSFVARYPGALGNSLKVSVCAKASLFSGWTYASYFTSAPGTSEYATSVGGSLDEMHIVVIDEDGFFTGVK